MINTDNKSKEHDFDKINIYTTSKGKDEDEDNGEHTYNLVKTLT
jgi:hypothetical protein